MLKLLDILARTITDLDEAIRKKNLKTVNSVFVKLRDFSDCLKYILPTDFTKENFQNFERHMHFIEHYIAKKDFEWIKSNFDDIKERDFPSIRTEIYTLTEIGKMSMKESTPWSNSVFIVHGKNRKSLKELQSMLKEFGLDPIVLYEQPSGSRTIIEKLEKYSNVGYAFVILTPDDRGGSFKKRSRLSGVNILEGMAFSARQNVILECGYFIGRLGRDRVCCLYKGNVELPSDMHGIVYIRFEESIDEARDMIMKELKAAGYEIAPEQRKIEKEDLEGNKSLRKEVEELKDYSDRRVD